MQRYRCTNPFFISSNYYFTARSKPALVRGLTNFLRNVTREWISIQKQYSEAAEPLVFDVEFKRIKDAFEKSLVETY